MTWQRSKIAGFPVPMSRVGTIEEFEGDRVVEWSGGGEPYVAVWYDYVRSNVTRWIFARVGPSGIPRYVAGMKSLRQLVDESLGGFVYLVDISGSATIESVTLTEARFIEDLPDDESFYDPLCAPARAPIRQNVLLDGDWSIRDLVEVDRKYRQVYAINFLLAKSMSSSSNFSLSFKLQDGWSYVHALNEAERLAWKETKKPGLQKLHYASPGVISFGIDSSIGQVANVAIHQYLLYRAQIRAPLVALRNTLRQIRRARKQKALAAARHLIERVDPELETLLGVLPYLDVDKVESLSASSETAARFVVSYVNRLEDVHRLRERATFVAWSTQ